VVALVAFRGWCCDVVGAAKKAIVEHHVGLKGALSSS